jgi:hypothetical protein
MGTRDEEYGFLGFARNDRTGVCDLTKKQKHAQEAARREAEEKKRVSQAKKKNKLVKGGKLGRPRKLTPDQLRRGVEEYFASISYQEPVTREEDVILSVDPKTGGVTFALDDKGHRIKRIVPVLNAAGKPLTRTVYTEAPGDFGLCNFLKISRDTWERYGRAVKLLEERRQGQATGDGGDGVGWSTTSSGPSGHLPLKGKALDGGDPSTACGGPPPLGRGGLDAGDGGRGGLGSGRPTAGNGTSAKDGTPPHPSPAATPSPQGEGFDEELREARDYAEIYALARGRVCAYLESAAETRGGRGAQFKLERIYGLTERKDVRLDAGGSIEAYLRTLEEDG